MLPPTLVHYQDAHVIGSYQSKKVTQINNLAMMKTWHQMDMIIRSIYLKGAAVVWYNNDAQVRESYQSKKVPVCT